MQRVFEGKGNQIRAGGQRFVNYLWSTDGSPVEPSSALLNTVSNFLQAHQGVRSIHVSVDLVLFEDGSLAGADVGQTIDMLGFRRTLYESVVNGYASGATGDSLFTMAQSAAQLGGNVRNMMRKRWGEEILELRQRLGVSAAVEFAKTKLTELPQVRQMHQ